MPRITLRLDAVGPDMTGVPLVTIAYMPASPSKPATPPSNVFTLSPRAGAPSGTVSVSVVIPGPGSLVARAIVNVRVGKRLKTLTYGVTTLSESAAGSVLMRIVPSAAARKALRRAGHLTVSLSVTFTPLSGTSSTRSTRVLVGTPRARHHPGHRP